MSMLGDDIMNTEDRYLVLIDNIYAGVLAESLASRAHPTCQIGTHTQSNASSARTYSARKRLDAFLKTITLNISLEEFESILLRLEGQNFSSEISCI